MRLSPVMNFIFVRHSIEYVKTKSIKYNIDDSHNHNHSIDVLLNGMKLIENKNKHYNNTSKSIIYLGCILHDMCDHKYMNEIDELENITNFLDESALDNKIKDAVMTIIPKMSYSKTVKNNTFILPSNLENFSYLEEYHIIRHADLLSAYNLFRTIDMRYHKLKKSDKIINMENIIKEADNIIQNRILTMIDSNIFIDKESKKLAKKYHNIALKKYNNWKMNGTMNYDEIKKLLQ